MNHKKIKTMMFGILRQTALILILALFSFTLTAQDKIVFTWQVKNGSFEINATIGQPFTINWGDGTVETKICQSDWANFASHNYATTGNYTVTVTASNNQCRFLYLGMDYSNITSLNLSGCSALSSLSCSYNNLTQLNVSGTVSLEYFSCSNNKLTSLDVSDSPKLINFECNDNQLTSLDLSGKTKLLDFRTNNNQLTSLKISNCSSLEWFECSNNLLTELDVTDCKKLHILKCAENKLSKINVTQCTIMTHFDCSNNQLTELDVTKCTQLNSLIFSRNNIKEIDLSKCKELAVLLCSDNQFSKINFSQTKSITSIDISKNNFSSVDLTPFTFLEHYYCYNNHFSLSDLYTAHLLVNFYGNKWLGTQNLSPKYTFINTEIFSDQSQFGGINTNYTVEKEGAPAQESDYSVSNGKIKFYTLGTYTVTMTNDVIDSHENYPAKVLVDIHVIDENVTLSDLKSSVGELNPEFAPTTTEYTIRLDLEIDEIQFFATPKNEDAVVSGDLGILSLVEGINNFTITVTYNDFSLNYNLTVIRGTLIGLNDTKKNFDIKVYPNPTTGKLKINNEQLTINNIEVYDIYGKNLAPHTTYHAPHTSLDISDLPAGVYFVKIYTDGGVAVEKVVKQ